MYIEKKEIYHFHTPKTLLIINGNPNCNFKYVIYINQRTIFL